MKEGGIEDIYVVAGKNIEDLKILVKKLSSLVFDLVKFRETG